MAAWTQQALTDRYGAWVSVIPVESAVAYELWGHVRDSALARSLLCLCVDAAHTKISHLQGSCVWQP